MISFGLHLKIFIDIEREISPCVVRFVLLSLITQKKTEAIIAYKGISSLTRQTMGYKEVK